MINGTAILAQYRNLADKLAEESRRWGGESAAILRGHAATLARAADVDPSTVDPIVATATIDAAHAVWIRAQASRGLFELGRMLNAHN